MAPMGADPDDSALVRDVRAAGAALAELVPHAVSFGSGMADSIRAACDAVEPSLEKTELVLAAFGDPGARRALLRLVLGENVVRAPAARRERVTRVRAAEAYDYVAREKTGKTVRFARIMPDRDADYRGEIEKAERAVEIAREERAVLESDVQKQREAVRAIEVEILALDEEVTAAGEAFAAAWRAERAAKTTHAAIESAVPSIPKIFVKAPPWWAVWLWLLRWILRAKWKEPLEAYERNRSEATTALARATDLGDEARGREAARDAVRARRTNHDEILARAQGELASVEVILSEESAVKKAEAEVERLLRERAKHAGERKEEFFSDLRDIDGSARGDDVDQLDVDYPADHPGAPPPGVVLLVAGAPGDDADGFFVVRDPSRAPPSDEELRRKLPRAAVLTLRTGGPPPSATLRRFAGSKLVVGARLAMRLRACIADVARAREVAEVEHQRRLGALESQRLPQPDEFRKKQVARSEPSIEKSAAEVHVGAREALRAGIEALAKEWTDRLATARGKSALEACVRDVNQRGKMQLLELLESVSERVAREMQDASESLERWALDEIQTSYRIAKKAGTPSLVPVMSEITGEELAREIAPRVPIPAALAKFRAGRLRLALAGAMVLAGAGAGAGVLAGAHLRIAVSAGAGFVLGALSAFLKPITTLRADCLASVQTYAADVTRAACAVLDDKRDAIRDGIRDSLDAALGGTLARLREAIERLMTIERNAIDAERAALAKLASTQATLEEHDARLRTRLDEAEAVFKASS